MAMGSCSEVKSMLYLSERLQYLTFEKKEQLLMQANDISKIIRGFIKSIN